MIIKIDDRYLDFVGDVEMERQVINIDNFDNVGDFSYSFNVEDTAYNRDVLGIKSIDTKNKTLFSSPGVAELQTDDGVTIHRGSIIVTDTVNISCSFISGNSNFFNSVNGNINEIDFSQFDVLLSESAITDSWSESSGVVFPIVDKGGLENRRDPYLKLRVRQGRVDLNDFQPFIYVKDVIKKTLALSGIKLSGDLIEDKTYTSLITTTNNRDYYSERFKNNQVYIGKTNTQTITDSVFTKIQFSDVASVQFFNSGESPFDATTNYRWTVSFDSLVNIIAGLVTSDPTKLINFQIRRNGTGINDQYIKGAYVEIEIYDGLNYEHATPGDYYEIWAKVDASTPGSVDLTGGTFTGEIISTAMIFANALLPDQPAKEFIKDIFRIFNVVCSFDNITRTLHTRFFENIKDQEEQDLSEYFVGEESENGFEIVSEYAQRSTLEYQQDSVAEIEKYNKENVVPYGNGVVEIDNDFLPYESTLYAVNFTAPFSKYYPYYGLQLLKLNFAEYTIPSGNEVAFTSVVDDGGEAEFSPSASGAITLKNNAFIDDADGTISGPMQMQENESSAQILAINMVNIALPADIRFTYDDGSSLPTGSEGFPYRISNSTTPAYNGDWENTLFSSAPWSNASVAYFAKYLDGTPLDTAKQGLSFGPISGIDSQTLETAFYRSFSSVLNDPVKPVYSMLIPENVYNNIDFLRPVRIKTEKFNSQFVLQKITSYKNSYTPCLFELIKL